MKSHRGKIELKSGPRFVHVFLMVALAHIILLWFFSWWSSHRPLPPQVLPFEMLPLGVLDGGGAPDPTPKISTAPPSPPSPPPEPERPPVVETPPAAEPEPIPTPAPSEIVIPTKPNPPKKKVEPIKKTTPKEEKPRNTKPKVKVNLEEVTRSDSSVRNAAEKNAKKTDRTEAAPSQAGIDAQEAANRLAQALGKTGAGPGTGGGILGDSNGSGKNYGNYYALIHAQMYAAWQQPIEFAGRGLRTQLQINVEKSGRISNVKLLRSSGNSKFDESALAAARKVGHIRQPLPEGMSGEITVNFKLDE